MPGRAGGSVGARLLRARTRHCSAIARAHCHPPAAAPAQRRARRASSRYLDASVDTRGWVAQGFAGLGLDAAGLVVRASEGGASGPTSVSTVKCIGSVVVVTILKITCGRTILIVQNVKITLSLILLTEMVFL